VIVETPEAVYQTDMQRCAVHNQRSSLLSLSKIDMCSSSTKMRTVLCAQSVVSRLFGSSKAEGGSIATVTEEGR